MDYLLGVIKTDSKAAPTGTKLIKSAFSESHLGMYTTILRNLFILLRLQGYEEKPENISSFLLGC